MSRLVLLIEDNEQNRYLVTFLLERSGYTVLACADGPGGIEAARLDPACDGYDFWTIVPRDPSDITTN